MRAFVSTVPVGGMPGLARSFGTAKETVLAPHTVLAALDTLLAAVGAVAKLDMVPAQVDTVPALIDTVLALVDTVPALVDTVFALVGAMPALVDTVLAPDMELAPVGSSPVLVYKVPEQRCTQAPTHTVKKQAAQED